MNLILSRPLGFTELNGKPKCVICLEVLSEESMKKNKLQKHLSSNHPGCIDKQIEFFERKLNSLKSQKGIMTTFTGVNKPAVYSSYVASSHIAKQKKPYTIGQNLIMPVAKEIGEIMIGEKERKLLDPIPLSASTVKRRILDIFNDILEQTVSQVNASPFYAIQLDESTNIAGLLQLLVFVQFVNGGEVVEDLLFCNTLKLHCRGEDIFNSLDGFFRNNSLSWENCAGICTDVAAACTGINSGVVK